jgi:hypothetical protein
MLQHEKAAPDVALDVDPDPHAFIRAAMEWHFSSATVSPYWLTRAESLASTRARTSRASRTYRCPANVANELRDVRVQDLIPRGFGPHRGSGHARVEPHDYEASGRRLRVSLIR